MVPLQDLFSVGDPLPDSRIPHRPSPWRVTNLILPLAAIRTAVFCANFHNGTSADTIHDLISSETPFVLRTLGQTDQSRVNLRGFDVEMCPFKYPLGHGVKDAAPNDTSKRIEMRTVNDEMIFWSERDS
jgi:hypothetical protein